MFFKIFFQPRITAFSVASLQLIWSSLVLGTSCTMLTASRSNAQTLEPPPLPQEIEQQEVEQQAPEGRSPLPQTFSPANPPPEGYSPPPFEDTTSNQFSVYRLDVGDAVRVNVPQFPEFNFQSVVDAQGTVTVPFLGRVSVLGLTLEEVEAKLRFELNRRFLREPPDVNAVLAGVRPVQITVIGEVVRPGYYTTGPGANLTSVLAQAQGSTEKADLRSVIVRRPLVDGTVIEEAVDLYTPLQNGSSQPRVRLQGGDVIVVPRLEVGNDEDYDTVLVSRTTIPQQQITVRVLVPAGTGVALRNLNLRNGSTFLDVVASLPSGDVLLIDRDEIGLMRFDPERGQVISQTLDAEAAIDGDISQDVPLRDEDVIVVSRSLLGKIFNTFNIITRPIRTFFGFRNFIDNFIDGDTNNRNRRFF